jgi:hypothetical protein
MARLDQALASHPVSSLGAAGGGAPAGRSRWRADRSLASRGDHRGAALAHRPEAAIAERGAIFEVARTALVLHQWLVAPDFDQEREVQSAEALLAVQLWTPVFLRALAREAEAGLDLLLALEWAWFAVCRAVASRRKSSHAVAVIDMLAATKVVSATTLAARLGIAVKNAIRLLDELVAADIAVEVTHRSRRRLFGLKGLAPLREGGSACRIVRNRGEGQGGRARWSTPKRPRRRCHSSRRWRAGPAWRFRPSWSQTRWRRPALPEGGAAQ